MTERRDRAEAIVKHSAGWALACGILPLPLLDIGALTLVNVRMLERLAELYELPFSRTRAEAYLAALLGSLTAAELALLVVRGPLMMIPGIGPLLGAASLSLSSGSITYAVGHIFIRQFESGGTFMAFEPASVQKGSLTQPAPEPAPEAPPAELPAASAPEPESSNGAPDDLTLVKGIGPKIAELLVESGIKTFHALAATPVTALKAILEDAGVHYAYHDPTSWPAQAREAAKAR